MLPMASVRPELLAFCAICRTCSSFGYTYFAMLVASVAFLPQTFRAPVVGVYDAVWITAQSFGFRSTFHLFCCPERLLFLVSGNVSFCQIHRCFVSGSGGCF